MRHKTVRGAVNSDTLGYLDEAGLTVERAEAIYKLTTLPNVKEQFVIPQYHRETAIEAWKDPLAHKGEVGFGAIQPPRRGE